MEGFEISAEKVEVYDYIELTVRQDVSPDLNPFTEWIFSPVLNGGRPNLDLLNRW